MGFKKDINCKRIVWLDIVRVLSALAVIFIHVSTNFINEAAAYGSFNWFCADIYTALSRCAVPLFVMISGVFFFDQGKEITINALYTKYIFRILVVLLAWALIRTLVISVGLNSVPADKFLASFYVSIKMYWFLPMIIGLYMITPVLRVMVAAKNKTLLLYFMTLSFVLALCVPFAEGVQLYYFPVAVAVSDFVNLIKLPMLIFGAHFVFGYYAYNYEISAKVKAILYVCAVVSVLLMSAGTYAFFNDKASKMFFYSMHGAGISPLAFLLGAAVFVFCKEKLGKISFSPWFVYLIQKLSSYSLGVYLLHIILVEAAAHFGLFGKLTAFSAIMIPLVCVAVFLLSNLILWPVSKVKILKKYLM